MLKKCPVCPPSTLFMDLAARAGQSGIQGVAPGPDGVTEDVRICPFRGLQTFVIAPGYSTRRLYYPAGTPGTRSQPTIER